MGEQLDTRFRENPLKIFAFLLGCAAIGASIYLSQEWALYNGLPDWMAWTVATTFVGFTTLIFEIGCGLLLQKLDLPPPQIVEQNGAMYVKKPSEETKKQAKLTLWFRRMMGVFCILLAIALECYTVASIAGAMYNLLVASKYTTSQKETAQSTESVASQTAIQNEKKVQNKKDTEALDKEWAQTTATYNRTLRIEFKDLKPTEIDALPVTQTYKLGKTKYELDKQTLKAALDTIDAELLKLSKEKDKSTNAGKTDQALNHGTVYTYLKTLTGIDEIYLQFWLTAWPSFFLGLINAFSFAYVLYGKSKKVSQKP